MGGGGGGGGGGEGGGGGGLAGQVREDDLCLEVPDVLPGHWRPEPAPQEREGCSRIEKKRFSKAEFVLAFDSEQSWAVSVFFLFFSITKIDLLHF